MDNLLTKSIILLITCIITGLIASFYPTVEALFGAISIVTGIGSVLIFTATFFD